MRALRHTAKPCTWLVDAGEGEKKGSSWTDFIQELLEDCLFPAAANHQHRPTDQSQCINTATRVDFWNNARRSRGRSQNT
jgi:hypothetical protein